VESAWQAGGARALGPGTHQKVGLNGLHRDLAARKGVGEGCGAVERLGGDLGFGGGRRGLRVGGVRGGMRRESAAAGAWSVRHASQCQHTGRCQRQVAAEGRGGR
jgi:hypothetical protein